MPSTPTKNNKKGNENKKSTLKLNGNGNTVTIMSPGSEVYTNSNDTAITDCYLDCYWTVNQSREVLSLHKIIKAQASIIRLYKKEIDRLVKQIEKHRSKT